MSNSELFTPPRRRGPGRARRALDVLLLERSRAGAPASSAVAGALRSIADELDTVHDHVVGRAAAGLAVEPGVIMAQRGLWGEFREWLGLIEGRADSDESWLGQLGAATMGDEADEGPSSLRAGGRPARAGARPPADAVAGRRGKGGDRARPANG